MTRCDADPEEVQGSAEAIARAKTAEALRVLRRTGHALEGTYDWLVTEDVRYERRGRDEAVAPRRKSGMCALH